MTFTLQPIALMPPAARALIRVHRGHLIGDLIKDGEPVDHAGEIVDEAVNFVWLCAIDDDTFGPSPEVDKGWHKMIARTRFYAELCATLGDRFVHHTPMDSAIVERAFGGWKATVDAMHRHGIPVNDALWATTADCGDTGCVKDCDNR